MWVNSKNNKADNSFRINSLQATEMKTIVKSQLTERT